MPMDSTLMAFFVFIRVHFRYAGKSSSLCSS